MFLAVALPAGAPAHERITTEVTYEREIERIFRAQCRSCHRAGGRAMSLATYAEVRPWAKAIRDEVESGRMPPWLPVRGVGDLVESATLSTREVDLVIAWAEGGAPEGEARDRSPLRVFEPPVEPPRRGRTLRVRKPITIDAALLVHAVTPRAPAGASIEVRALLPDGAQRPLVWIRAFDERYAGTYALREPLRLPARSRIVIHGAASASASLTVTDVPAPPVP